jgi:CSLREA domain-containing protein
LTAHAPFVDNETRRTVKQRMLFRCLVGTALLALPFIGLQLLQGSSPQVGGREPSARPADPPGFLFVVTSTGDGDISPPGGTVCDDGTGHCTLRAAIEAANNTSGTDDIIQFSIPTSDPGYDPSTGRYTINLNMALPDLSTNITIAGPGANVLTVTRPNTGGGYRIFNVTTTGTLTVSGLTISKFGIPTGNGGAIQNFSTATVNVISCTLSDNGAGSGVGGAIYNNSTGAVNVTNCTLSGNFAGIGGAIYNNSTGTVNVTNSTIGDNQGTYGGGAIYNNSSGQVNVTNSTISDNFTNQPDYGGGGGIFNNMGRLSVTNCTIKDNIARGNGGGIVNLNAQGTLNILNSTLTGNISTQDGGGISISFLGTVTITNSTIRNNGAGSGRGGGLFCSNGTVNVDDSTFSGNEATYGGGVWNGLGTVTLINSTLSGNHTPDLPYPGFGGGIWNDSTGTINLGTCTISNNSASSIGGGLNNNGSGPFNVKSSIIALNTAAGSGPDVWGTFTSQGFNLVGIDQNNGFNTATDHKGGTNSPLDPKLDPNGLQNNGGPTQTIALLSTSPAINSGDTNALPRDQRGYVRQNAADIGAFEFGATIPVTLANISTRAFVQTGDNVMIGGVIITGSGQKRVIVRAIGPSLVNFGITNPLQDPTLELHDGTGTLITSNDNWMDAPNKQAIIDSGLAPSDNLESAILTSLNPGAYTAIVRGVNNGTGIALVEGFDLDRTVVSKLGNISTRALVQTGDNVMIGGLIITGPDSDKVIVRAIGPSLAQYGITNPLADPTLELHDGNGMVIAFDDNWKDSQQAEIQATGLAPSNDLESAIVATLAPGNYTAIVRGKNDTIGIALVEVFGLN